MELSELTSLGLTEAQARIILEEFPTPEAMTVELVKMAFEGSEVRRPPLGVIAQVVSRATTPDTEPSPQARPERVANIESSRELLTVLGDETADEDRRRNAATELRGRGKRVIFVGSSIDYEQTHAMWAHPAEVGRWWGKDQLPVVDPFVVLESDALVELDPRDGTPLVDGVNPETGADWSEVSDRRRALVRLAGGPKGVELSADPMSLADSLRKEELPRVFQVLLKRVTEEEIREAAASLRVRHRDLKRAPAAPAYEAPYAPAVHSNPMVAMSELLCESFSVHELRRVLTLLESALGASLVSRVAWGGPVAEVAFETASLLQRDRFLSNPTLYRVLHHVLCTERPGRAAEFRAIAAAAGIKL